MVFNATLSTIF